MYGWFEAQIVHTGRLPLFCFFVTFVVGFGFIRLSARLIRARVRWWPGNVVAGRVHIHHMVFGVVLMCVGGVAELAAPISSLGWRSGAGAVFGLGTALVLDEFALILHLRDVYWSNEGRLSIDAVLVAAGVTALLLIGVSPVGVGDVASDRWLPGGAGAVATLIIAVLALFALAVVTLLKGKIGPGSSGCSRRRCSSSAPCGWPGRARPGPAGGTATGPEGSPGPDGARSACACRSSTRRSGFRICSPAGTTAAGDPGKLPAAGRIRDCGRPGARAEDPADDLPR